MFGIQLINRRNMNRLSIILILISGMLMSSCDLVDSISGNKESSTVELYPVLLDGDWGYINKDGAMIIEPQFQYAAAFSDGVAGVRHNWSWTYIDQNGDVLFEDTNFQEITSFSEGKAAVRVDGRWGYINKKGNFVINPRFRGATPFSDGRAFVRSLDYSQYLYIDENGNAIESLTMPDDMDYVEDNLFRDERALVRDNDLYGYIDKTGNSVVDPKYSEALSFSDKLAAVRVSDRWGYINKSGSVEIAPQFISAGKFGNGLAPARLSSNQYGYINKSGVFVIEEQFDEVRSFSEERAAVMMNGRGAFINKEGEQITGAKFDEVDEFYNGLARVMVYSTEGEDIIEQFGYINKSGNYVWFPTR